MAKRYSCGDTTGGADMWIGCETCTRWAHLKCVHIQCKVDRLTDYVQAKQHVGHIASHKTLLETKKMSALKSKN